MKITFTKEHISVYSGNSLYKPGAEADLVHGQKLVDLGVAHAGWGEPSPPAETKVVRPRKVKETSLDDYNVAELKAMAKEAGIDGFSTMRKAELIEALGG